MRRTTTENGGARSPSNKCERRVGLWQALGGRSEVRFRWLARPQEVCHRRRSRGRRFWWLARPQEVCHRKCSRSRRQGGRPIWGSYPRRDRSAASENVPTHGNSSQNPHEIRSHYPGGPSPTTTVRDILAITDLAEETGSQGEGDQDVERGLEGPEEFGARAVVGLSITLLGSRGKTTLEYPFRAPMEALCAPAACWTARKTSREDLQILGSASRVARRGREEADLPIRRSWLEGYPWTGMREGGGR